MHAKVAKRFQFSAAHQNLHDPGACSRVHGHTYYLEVYAEGKVNFDPKSPEFGMVVPFSRLKAAYTSLVEPYVEHHCLTETLDFLAETTTECIAEWCLWQFRSALSEVYAVRLWEGEKAYAEVEAGPCVLWRGETDRDGYGVVQVGAGVRDKAHRIAWIEEHGPIPEGWSILHHCDTPSCYEPSHLFIGTHNDNMADARRKMRGPGRGKLTPEDVLLIRQKISLKESRAKLAKEYQVSVVSIDSIANRLSWGHLP